VTLPDFHLYLITDRKQTGGRDLLWVLEQALEGGVKAVQLREKDLTGKELFSLAEKTLRLCQNYGAHLFINDRVDVCLAINADGVQIGTSSLPVDAARQLLGPLKLIGASTHSLEEAREAQRRGADFVLFGPVFHTAAKASYGPPQGLTALKAVVEKLSRPVYAIGGIQPDNVEETRRTGIRGVALISAVISASDPKGATAKILKFFQR
jgi:thiamine-phosphate pyrophosphorylase